MPFLESVVGSIDWTAVAQRQIFNPAIDFRPALLANHSLHFIHPTRVIPIQIPSRKATMRHPALTLLSVAFLLSFSQPIKADTPIDLKSAYVITPDSLTPREKKAVDLLLDEIESRTQIRLPLLHSLPSDNSPSILI